MLELVCYFIVVKQYLIMLVFIDLIHIYKAKYARNIVFGNSKTYLVANTCKVVVPHIIEVNTLSSGKNVNRKPVVHKVTEEETSKNKSF